MENFDKLKEILVDVLGVKIEDVKAESKFVDDLGADSLDL
ncbi:MAG: acyl carrier protein, partial [Actinobacteria bacterium]|nr:acyl carrier protein [Actinomycetota bacterium]